MPTISQNNVVKQDSNTFAVLNLWLNNISILCAELILLGRSVLCMTAHGFPKLFTAVYKQETDTQQFVPHPPNARGGATPMEWRGRGETWWGRPTTSQNKFVFAGQLNNHS